jgi:hypothetical protein
MRRADYIATTFIFESIRYDLPAGQAIHLERFRVAITPVRMKAIKPQTRMKDQGEQRMKNNMSKFMVIAAAAMALMTATQANAGPGGGGSGSTSPTPVEEQAVPARTAVDVPYFCGQNTSTCSTTFAVPTGMRLVIESFSGGLGTASAYPLRVFFMTTLDGVQYTEILSPNAHTAYSGVYYMSDFSRNMKIYTDSVTTMPVLGTLSTTNFFHFHGYLVKK